MRVGLRYEGGEGHPSATVAVAAPKPTPPSPTPDPVAVLIARSDSSFRDRPEGTRRSATSNARRPSSIGRSISCSSPPTARAAMRDCANTSIASSIASASWNRPRSTTGDGFTETQVRAGGHRRAAGHRNLRIVDAEALHGRDGRGRPPVDVARHSDPDQRPRAALRRAVPGPASRVPDRRPVARRAVSADDPGRRSAPKACRWTSPTSR